MVSVKRKIDGIDVLIEEADKYLQIDDIDGDVLNRIWPKLQADYAGFDKWFCFHNTEIPHALLSGIGMMLVDDCIEMRLSACALGDSDAQRVTRDDFDEFAAHHEARHPEMYWTGERIKRDASRWGVFTTRSDGKISGYVIISLGASAEAEIFCVDAQDSAVCVSLIRRAAGFAFEHGQREVLFMADRDTVSQQAAASVGFVAGGFYKGYVVRGSMNA